MARSSEVMPSNWPRNLEFLTASRLSKYLSSDARQHLTELPAGTTACPPAPAVCPRVKIKPIVDISHPADGQHGLFASQHLPPDTMIISYLGFVHAEDEADASSSYDLSLDRDFGLGVDATHMGNEARFINDYRGTASSANAEFRDVWVETGGGRSEKRMGVFVLSAGKSGKRAKGIGKGEEILVSYGKGFWNAVTG